MRVDVRRVAGLAMLGSLTIALGLALIHPRLARGLCPPDEVKRT
jgi:hypothetical protein